MNDAEQFFADATGYIRRGRAMLAEGRESELKSLDAEAALLADRTGTLANELMAQHGERFAGLMTELEAFVREMEERRKTTSECLSALQQYRRASIAYVTADKSDREG